MSRKLLDRTESYLELFSEDIVIDKNLLKWKKIKENQEKEEKELAQKAQELEYNEKEGYDTKVLSYEETEKINNKLEQKLTFQQLIEMNIEDFNIFVSKKLLSKTFKKYGMSSFEFDGSEQEKIFVKKNFVQKGVEAITQYFRTWTNKEKEEVVKFDAYQFFDEIKNLSKSEEQTTYVNRIKPFIIALKQANEMGQKALADKLIANIFKNKYESILISTGFKYRIKEEQIVYFIKNAEKGIKIDYIKNFSRPIPEQAQIEKRKADNLLIFDNYVVMHYDPDEKSYNKTKEEEEAERQRRRDPILFGVIYGSRELYYITDWVDDYCDLTLEQFADVSGFDKKVLELNQEIIF